METEVILSGLSPASEVNETTVHQQTSGGGTASAACEEVFATIHMETEQMLADVDNNDSGARGNSAEIEKVADQWVAVPASKKGTWRNVCLSFIYDRVLRLNDGATTHDACHYALEMYRVLEAKGELLLNDCLYDNFDCGQLWVLGGQQRRGGTPISQDDARRDPRSGWVPSEIPFGYGRVKMQVRDIMGNVWSAHYLNNMFSFRHFDREATADEKVAVTCRPHNARIFDPPLGNPVELALGEGTVFSGEKCITYVHVRGKETTFDGICMDVWDHVAMRKDVVATSNIVTHVIQEGQLYQHVARDMYGYHVNWVPGSLHPAVVDGKVTLAARMQSALHRLNIATSEVDRNRSREEGWKLVAREADVALHAADGHTSAGEEIVRTVFIARSPINTMSTQEVEEEDVFNDWTMTEQRRERGFEDSSLPIDFEYDIDETRVRNNEKDARAPNNEVEVSGSDVSSDEEGEEYDAYWDMEARGGQASKGWAHAILRLARVFSNPHLLLRVVLKEATREGALQYVALTTIMRSCSNGRRRSQESNPEGDSTGDNTDRSEEGEEEEEGNSEDEERDITSAENSAKYGTTEKKADALENSSNGKQIVQRENVPLQEFIELSFCLLRVDLNWTWEDDRRPASETVELLIIQAWRTNVAGDLLGFVFGAVDRGNRSQIVRELTIVIARLADELPLDIVSQSDEEPVPHTLSRTLAPSLQWSACIEERWADDRFPSRSEYIDVHILTNPRFFQQPTALEWAALRAKKEAEEDSEGELRREAGEAAARLAEDEEEEREAEEESAEAEEEEEEEEDAEEETSEEEEEAYSEHSEAEQSEEEDEEDDEEVESGDDQEPTHVDELEWVPGPD
ncbi:hypothetical protein CBR_g12381 [Chara braunii]|uniref:Uncharacterized protein n=1 Tax=Chara braunii TaxID=69332 RepID=A0A388KRY2_CHABU|nr:hypothetical protein CBR_g12381 [Chara braunii]|eukprot:GBG72814.1 hypothetical protein CBR_g12381 [Chara braunii]